MKTFAGLCTPQFAGLVKGACGNLVSEFNEEEIKQER